MGVEREQNDTDQLCHTDNEIKDKFAAFSSHVFENLWTEMNNLGVAPSTAENHSAVTVLGVMIKSYHIMQAMVIHQMTGSLQHSNAAAPQEGGRKGLVKAQKDDGADLDREFSQLVVQLTRVCEGEWAALSNLWPDNSKEMEEIQELMQKATAPTIAARVPGTQSMTLRKRMKKDDGVDGADEAPEGDSENVDPRAHHSGNRETAFRKHDGRQLLSVIAYKVKDSILARQSAEEVKTLQAATSRLKDQLQKEKKEKKDNDKHREKLETQVETLDTEVCSLRAQLDDSKKKLRDESAKNQNHPPEPAGGSAPQKRSKATDESDDKQGLKQELRQTQQGLSQAEDAIKAKNEEIASLTRRLQRAQTELQKKAPDGGSAGGAEDLAADGPSQKSVQGERRTANHDVSRDLEMATANAVSTGTPSGRSGDPEESTGGSGAEKSEKVAKLKKQLEEERQAKKSWEDRANAAERKVQQLQQQQGSGQQVQEMPGRGGAVAEQEKTPTNQGNTGGSAAPPKATRELVTNSQASKASSNAAMTQQGPVDWNDCPNCQSLKEKNKNLQLAIEELRTKIAKLMQKLSGKLDNEDLEEFVDQAGLGSVMKCRHSVFERLYQDAIVRLQRLASLQEQTRAASSDHFVRVMRAIGVSFEESADNIDVEDVANKILNYLDRSKDHNNPNESGSVAPTPMPDSRGLYQGVCVAGGPQNGNRNPQLLAGPHPTNFGRPISRPMSPGSAPQSTELEMNHAREGRLPRPPSRGGLPVPAASRCDSRGASPRPSTAGGFGNPGDSEKPMRAWSAGGVGGSHHGGSHHGNLDPIRHAHRPPTILSSSGGPGEHRPLSRGGGPPRPLTLASAVGCPGGLTYSRLGRSAPSLHGRCGSPGPGLAANSGTFREYWRPQSAIAASH